MCTKSTTFKLPVATLTIATCALLMTVLTSASLALSLPWMAQLSTLILAHLSHWTLDHFFWDVGAFLLLGTLLECDLMVPAECRQRASHQHIGAHFIASSLFISSLILAFPPSYQLYRGLSGFCTVTFALLLLRVGTFARQQHNHALTFFTLLCAIGLAGKVLYEVTYASPLFAEMTGFTVAPEAHLYGLLYVALFTALRSMRGAWKHLVEIIKERSSFAFGVKQ